MLIITILLLLLLIIIIIITTTRPQYDKLTMNKEQMTREKEAMGQSTREPAQLNLVN